MLEIVGGTAAILFLVFKMDNNRGSSASFFWGVGARPPVQILGGLCPPLPAAPGKKF